MKKVFLTIVSLCVCMMVCFSAVGCKSKDYGTTTTDTSKVSANGGSSVVYNNHLYFVNGFVKNDGKTNGGTLGSIYKVALNDDGTIAEDATYTKVVDALVGYNKGSINIIGNFLYYTTPGTGKNAEGVLYFKTVFKRINLETGKIQEIYKTADNNEKEGVSFAYYKAGQNNADLYLVVFEDSSQTLKSFKIGNEIQEVLSEDKVVSAIFSDKMGVCKIEDCDDCADNFIFYTKAYEENYPDTNTNRVYRVEPTGTNNTLISDRANITLKHIRNGKLLFQQTVSSTNYIFAYPITSLTTKEDFNSVFGKAASGLSLQGDYYQYIVSCNVFDNIIYLEEENGDIAILYQNGTYIVYEKYTGGISPSVTYSIPVFPSNPTVQFIGTYNDEVDGEGYIVYSYKDDSSQYIIYKLRYTFDNQQDVDNSNPEQVKLSTTNVKSTSSDDKETYGKMTPKIVDNYIYVFVDVKDDDGDDDTVDKENSLLHRINIYTPEEVAEQVGEEPGSGEGTGSGEGAGSGEGSGEGSNEGEDPEDEEEKSLEVGKAEKVGGVNI